MAGRGAGMGSPASGAAVPSRPVPGRAGCGERRGRGRGTGGRGWVLRLPREGGVRGGGAGGGAWVGFARWSGSRDVPASGTKAAAGRRAGESESS